MRTLMKDSMMMIIMLCAPAVAVAEAEPEPDRSTGPWYVQVGAYDHYGNKEKYKGRPLFGGIEYHRKDRLIIGFSIFNNSFDQFSQYAYVGKAYHPWQKHPAFRFKLTIGVAHGYEGENHKVLPIRWGDAWGVGLVPTIGYQRDRLGVDLGLLSASGLMLLVGFTF